MSDTIAAAPVKDGTIDPALYARLSDASAGAVRAGDFAPTFRLQGLHGGSVALVDLLAQGPVVISFYRGLWCDFCDTALEALSAHDGAFRSFGASQVAIGPIPSDEVQARRLGRLVMPVLLDRRLRVASAYGLTAALPPAVEAQYQRLGFAPSAKTIAGEAMVPIPATYVVDRDGWVILASIDLDYRNRLSPGDLQTALKALAGAARAQPST